MNKDSYRNCPFLIELFLNRGNDVSPVTICEYQGVIIYEMNFYYKEFMKDKISANETTCVEIIENHLISF